MEKNPKEERFLREISEYNPCFESSFTRRSRRPGSAAPDHRRPGILQCWDRQSSPRCVLFQSQSIAPSGSICLSSLFLPGPVQSIISGFFQPRSIVPSSDLSLQLLTLIVALTYGHILSSFCFPFLLPLCGWEPIFSVSSIPY